VAKLPKKSPKGKKPSKGGKALPAFMNKKGK
jgi:hypothetical protein